MYTFDYVGPAVLSVQGGARTARFRGRVLRDRATGALRFCVNLMPSGRVPDGWIAKGDWVEHFDPNDLEWVGPRALQLKLEQGSETDPQGARDLICTG